MCGPTVDEPDGRHGDGEEGVRLHGDLDQSGSEGEEDEDDDHAEGHTETLPHPAHRPDRRYYHQHVICGQYECFHVSCCFGGGGVNSPLIQERVEQREQQQGQLGKQGHPAVVVVVFGCGA